MPHGCLCKQLRPYSIQELRSYLLLSDQPDSHGQHTVEPAGHGLSLARARKYSVYCRNVAQALFSLSCSHLAVHGRLQASGIKLATLGLYGPLEGSTEAMDLEVDSEHHWFHQSVAFVVAEKPEQPLGPWEDLTDDEAVGNPSANPLAAHSTLPAAKSSLQAVEKASTGRSTAVTQQAAFTDSAQKSTKPSSQTKAVDGHLFNLPGTEHASNSQLPSGSGTGSGTAVHPHRGGASQHGTSVRAHISSHGTSNRHSR